MTTKPPEKILSIFDDGVYVDCQDYDRKYRIFCEAKEEHLEFDVDGWKLHLSTLCNPNDARLVIEGWAFANFSLLSEASDLVTTMYLAWLVVRSPNSGPEKTMLAAEW